MGGETRRVWLLANVVLVLALAPESTRAQASADATAKGEPDSLDARPEVMVITASRKEQSLQEVPAAVTVLDAQQIGTAPADDFADLIRGVPGVNVAKTSALDISVSSRGATAAIPQGQLVMVDHRATYTDFNNFVVWAGLPVELEEIDRIEIVRGPGGAVWGANATDGVVHVITQKPRDAVGTTLKLGGGEIGSGFGSVVHNGVTGRLGYRVSGGWVTQDPYDQPTGVIPGTIGPSNPGGTPYPDYENHGLDLFRGNVRVDYEASPTTTWSVSGGISSYEGIFLTPSGPFRFDDGTFNAFGKVDWLHDSTRVTFYTNVEETRGDFLLLPPSDAGNGDSRIYNLDASDTRNFGTRHNLIYGANVRYADFGFSEFAPDAEARDQYGAYLQDDIYLTQHFRFVAGARWDNIEPMGNAISPRAALLITPSEGQEFRLAYNRAFVAPSVLENYLFLVTPVVISIPDGGGGTLDLVFPTTTRGNRNLTEERLDAFEVAWMGRIADQFDVSIAAYRNEVTDVITSKITSVFTSSNPPPGWPLNPAALDVPPPAGFAGIPATIEQANAGKLINKGVEVTASVQVTAKVTLGANYSWQDVPETEGFDLTPLPDGTARPAVNIPPRHRFNANAVWDEGRYYLNASLNHQSEAYWADFFDPSAWGPTAAFTMINAGAGVRLRGGRVTISVNAQNLFDADVQQHNWGDFLRRKVTGQVMFRF